MVTRSTIQKVVFDEKSNGYYFGSEKYERVSRLLDIVKVPFDKEGISFQMAKRDVLPHETVEQAQKRILSGWNDITQESLDTGNEIHNALEDYVAFGKIAAGYEKTVEDLSVLIRRYKIIEAEAILYLHSAKLAGTTDLKCHRGRGGIIDYFDYKTNIRNGIRFDSGKFKDGQYKFYNKFFLPPLGHMEDCNYNRYCLQLSAYAYMDEQELGITPGRLGILFVNKSLRMVYIPVPYLKLEIQELINHYLNLRSLP